MSFNLQYVFHWVEASNWHHYNPASMTDSLLKKLLSFWNVLTTTTLWCYDVALCFLAWLKLFALMVPNVLHSWMMDATLLHSRVLSCLLQTFPHACIAKSCPINRRPDGGVQSSFTTTTSMISRTHLSNPFIRVNSKKIFFIWKMFFKFLLWMLCVEFLS